MNDQESPVFKDQKTIDDRTGKILIQMADEIGALRSKIEQITKAIEVIKKDIK